MKIVQEKVGRDKFIELSLTKKECQILEDYLIISQKTEIGNEEYNVGVKLELFDEENI